MVDGHWHPPEHGEGLDDFPEGIISSWFKEKNLKKPQKPTNQLKTKTTTKKKETKNPPQPHKKTHPKITKPENLRQTKTKTTPPQKAPLKTLRNPSPE